MTSARVSTIGRAWELDDSQEADRTLVFLVLKTGKALLTAAALGRPTQFVEFDA
jgi:hypothetical protein